MQEKCGSQPKMANEKNNCLWGGEREVKAKGLSLQQNMGDLATMVDIFEKSILAIKCDSAHIKALCAGQIVLNTFTPPPAYTRGCHLFFGCPGLLITAFFPCPSLINHYKPFIFKYSSFFHFLLQCSVLFYHIHFSTDPGAARG